MPPPKKTSPAAKTTAKAPAKTAAKPAAKGAAAKPAGKAPPAKTEEKAAPPAPKPIVFTEMNIKEIDKRVVYDQDGAVKDSGKWACIVDENSLAPRFLRHRDVNMLTVPDPHDMEPETIRKALIGAIKFGKPLVLDMMESEMWEFAVDQFDKIMPGLMETVLSKAILEPETYIKLYRESDGSDYQNMYNYNVAGFTMLITTSLTAPNENMLQKTYPVKIV